MKLFGTVAGAVLVATLVVLSSFESVVHAAAAAAVVDADDGGKQLLLRRGLKDQQEAYVYEAGRTWQPEHADRRAAQEGASSFYRFGPDYGTHEDLGRYEYSKGNKSGKGTSYSPVHAYGTKSGKKDGSKGGTKGGSKGKGSKAMYPYPPYDTPTYTYGPVKYPGPAPVKDPTRPPYYQPAKAPVHEPSPTPNCPDPELPEKCLYDESEGKDYCKDPGLTCQKRCLPALCKVDPHGPPKYHDGHAYDPPTTYVPIGSTCKWWEYATSRGEPEICCEHKEYSDYDPPGCGVCYDCNFPQVVNEACCAFFPGPPKLHDSEHGPDHVDRSGEYKGCRDGKICCKCGPHSYKCIPDDEYHQCDATVCGFEPSPKPTMSEPTPSPTPVPTPQPSPGPTPQPSPGPTPQPSPAPTPQPSPGPTPQPSPAPTPQPSPAPTPLPTPSPTQSLDCGLVLDVSCVSSDDTSIPCEEIVPEPVLCQARPVDITMLYNGGDCNQSSNMQGSSLGCTDEDPGGPPLTGTAFIEVAEFNGPPTYFEEVVAVGEVFIVATESGFPPTTAIRIYNEQGGTLLQSLVFTTSCMRRPLFLGDRFGATQVVGWVDEAGVVVDSVVNVTYQYEVVNNGALNVLVAGLNSTVTPPGTTLNLTDRVSGITIAPTDTLQPRTFQDLDLSRPTNFTVETTFTGVDEQQTRCIVEDSFEFEAGPAPVPDPTPGCGLVIDVSCLSEADPAISCNDIDPDDDVFDFAIAIEILVTNELPTAVTVTELEVFLTTVGVIYELVGELIFLGENGEISVQIGTFLLVDESYTVETFVSGTYVDGSLCEARDVFQFTIGDPVR